MNGFFNQNNWHSPQTLALLGAAGGFLDPNGGMGAGFQGAMQGMMGGHQLRAMQDAAELKKAQAQMKQQELLRQIEMRNWWQQNIRPGDTSRDVANKVLSSGYPELLAHMKNLPQYKAKIETVDGQGKPVVKFIDTVGNIENTGETPWKAPIKMDQGGFNALIDPVTMKAVAQYGKTMSPDAGANLAQRKYEFGMNYNLDRDKFALDQYRALKPEFRDGYFISPPNATNPQGSIMPTDLATAPKGSEMEKQKLRSKVEQVIGNDTEDLIKKATGSYLGQARDFAGRIIGQSTPATDALNALQMRAATLAGNMPRFEGPQSDADRKYYLQMAGDLGNPDKTVDEKLTAFKELKRMFNLVDENGVVNTSRQNDLPSYNDRNSYISPDGIKSTIKNMR